jgi:hypothetical protein
VWEKVKVLRSKIEKWVQNSGLAAVCARIKDSEKQYLLTGKTSWFSKNHISGPGISENCTKVLLTIHRNMQVRPKLDLNSIQHKSKDIDAFITKYQDVIQTVMSDSRMNLTPFEEQFTYEGPYWKTEMSKSRYNPFTCDPTVDSNDRTGGCEAPLQVTWKGRSNGPSIGSQFKDLCALKKHEPHLVPIIHRLWDEYLYKFDENQYIPHDEDCDCVTSKVIAIPDKSCKTRVVAVLDTYTQVSLRPVHFMLEQVLHKLHSSRFDYTFNHLQGVHRAMEMRDELWSVDLSSATDTLPSKLSFAILRSLVKPTIASDPEQFCSDVQQLMTDRYFHYNGGKVKYSTGQPMGAYASFPLLALTNHVIVRMAQILTFNKVRNGSYVIVGDDIVISNRKVAECYIQLMDEMGVPINR